MDLRSVGFRRWFCHCSSLSFHLSFPRGSCSVLSSENISRCSHQCLMPQKSEYQLLY